MEHWDPIGVRDVPEAVNEYDGYIGGAYSLLSRDASPEEIADHLRRIESEWMGLGQMDHQQRIAAAVRLREAFTTARQGMDL